MFCVAQVLLIREGIKTLYPSPYLDEHGEEDWGLERCRLMFLSEDRYNALQLIWQRHDMPNEVTAGPKQLFDQDWF